MQQYKYTCDNKEILLSAAAGWHANNESYLNVHAFWHACGSAQAHSRQADGACNSAEGSHVKHGQSPGAMTASKAPSS